MFTHVCGLGVGTSCQLAADKSQTTIAHMSMHSTPPAPAVI